MRSTLSALFLALSVIGLGGCETPQPRPDYTIKLMPARADGSLVAIPPECEGWESLNYDSLENQPWPRYGCANARNLAVMVDRPDDLVAGRDSGLANPETTANATRRYVTDKTKPLIDPNAKAPLAPSTQLPVLFGGSTTQK